MKPDVGAQIINQRTILEKMGLNVRVLIVDKDSFTITVVHRGNSPQIFKLAERNHLQRYFGSELYELQKSYKENKE